MTAKDSLGLYGVPEGRSVPAFPSKYSGAVETDLGELVELSISRPIQKIHLKKFLALLNEKPKRSPLLPPGFEAAASAGEILKGWIDKWIDSGRLSIGGEDPRRRNADNNRELVLTVNAYSMRGGPNLLLRGNEVRLVFLNQTASPGLIKQPNQREEAEEKLTFFLLSDLRFKLAKCRSEACGKYFVLNKWNQIYPNGTFCQACIDRNSSESAKAATAKERNAAAQELYRLAARHFRRQVAKTPDWHRDRELKASIASWLNDEIKKKPTLSSAYPNGVTAKWVSWSKNYNAITKAHKSLTRAKQS